MGKTHGGAAPSNTMVFLIKCLVSVCVFLLQNSFKTMVTEYVIIIQNYINFDFVFVYVGKILS